jgi:hypothetical protein
MFNTLIELFRIRKDKCIKSQYKKGYDFAAGKILRREETPLSLDEMQDMDPCSFDRGMNAAINYLVILKVVEEDRV